MEPLGSFYRIIMTYRPYTSLAAASLSDTGLNNTGVAINKGIPVRIDSIGNLAFIDVSIEGEVDNIAGVATESIANAAIGGFATAGRLEDITTTAVLGDLVYVSKAGGLTNLKPSDGIGGFLVGDFVISVGVVAKNQTNPLLKDLIININLEGQL